MNEILTRTRIPMMLFVVFVLLAAPAKAQTPLEDAIKQLSSDNVRGYLQPFVNGFGANMNSGWYNTAEIGKSGLHLKLRFIGMGTMIGDAEKMYVASSPFDQSPVQTATVFGDIGTIVPNDPSDPIAYYHFQNGQVKTKFVPFAVPQLTVGDFFGTQASVRYIASPEISNFPKSSLFGIGIRHSINQYFPTIPLDIAAGLFYQKLKIGDLMEAKAFNFGVQASKSFSILTLYGGLQSESSSMTVNYIYTGIGSTPDTKVSLEMDGENKFRATVGAGLNLVILHLNTDINFGKVTVVSGSVGFGF
jgi:hypothetical protein